MTTLLTSETFQILNLETFMYPSIQMFLVQLSLYYLEDDKVKLTGQGQGDKVN